MKSANNRFFTLALCCALIGSSFFTNARGASAVPATVDYKVDFAQKAQVYGYSTDSMYLTLQRFFESDYKDKEESETAKQYHVEQYAYRAAFHLIRRWKKSSPGHVRVRSSSFFTDIKNFLEELSKRTDTCEQLIGFYRLAGNLARNTPLSPDTIIGAVQALSGLRNAETPEGRAYNATVAHAFASGAAFFKTRQSFDRIKNGFEKLYKDYEREESTRVAMYRATRRLLNLFPDQTIEDIYNRFKSDLTKFPGGRRFEYIVNREIETGESIDDFFKRALTSTAGAAPPAAKSSSSSSDSGAEAETELGGDDRDQGEADYHALAYDTAGLRSESALEQSDTEDMPSMPGAGGGLGEAPRAPQSAGAPSTVTTGPGEQGGRTGGAGSSAVPAGPAPVIPGDEVDRDEMGDNEDNGPSTRIEIKAGKPVQAVSRTAPDTQPGVQTGKATKPVTGPLPGVQTVVTGAPQPAHPVLSAEPVAVTADTGSVSQQIKPDVRQEKPNALVHTPTSQAQQRVALQQAAPQKAGWSTGAKLGVVGALVSLVGSTIGLAASYRVAQKHAHVPTEAQVNSARKNGTLPNGFSGITVNQLSWAQRASLSLWRLLKPRTFDKGEESLQQLGTLLPPAPLGLSA